MKLILSEPSVVVQCPEVYDIDKIPWGEYQFPKIDLTDDGRFHVKYYVSEDSATAFGKPLAHAISSDGGKTWLHVNEDEGYTAGVFLKDGSAVRCYNLRKAIRLDKNKEYFAKIGEPDDEIVFWCEPSYMYYSHRLGDYSWDIEKKKQGGEWHKLYFDLKLPENHARYTSQGVMPYNNIEHLKVAPDGKLWALSYPFFINGYNGKSVNQPVFMVSEDNGETFKYRSTIPYQPIPEADKLYAVRDGFTEPDVAFLPNGEMICIMRTQDGNGNGPTYISRSADEGYTWSKPEIFDNLGVWPNLVTLPCGVTIVIYGRPGIYLRATADPEGKIWEDRVTVIDPEVDSCCNASIVVTGENTASFVYTHFTYPDNDGIPRKTILYRSLEVIFE